MKYYALVAGQCAYIGEYETWDDMEDDVSCKDWDSYDWIFSEDTFVEFVKQATELMEQTDA